MIRDSVDDGSWVMLQNCHLMASWMPTLERIVEGISPTRVHQNFRLWLTSAVSPDFPVSILQNSVKMVNEPPRGLKASLFRAFQGWTDEKLNGCSKVDEWKRLLFGLFYFHALVLERRKFGPLGWNIAYDFNDSDLDVCVRQLQIFLDSTDSIPRALKSLNLIFSQVNYGGRVTDNWDRRCIEVILADIYTKEAAMTDNFPLSQSNLYRIPKPCSLAQYQDYIASLDMNDPPEAFGMHQNAIITYGLQETTRICQSALVMLPRQTGTEGDLWETTVLDTSHSILAQLPERPFDLDSIARLFPVSHEQSYNTVLHQEASRYNRLLRTVRHSLKHVEQALDGEILMSSALEAVANSIFNGLIPTEWSKVAFPSLKPLGSWVKDLVARLDFINNWIQNKHPNVVWMSGLFFPQSFLTATLQNFVRKYHIPIDAIAFSFEVMPGKRNTITAPAPDGCYIDGLYLESAKWDYEHHAITEPDAKVLYSEMPVIWLKPRQKSEEANDARQRHTFTYNIPVYKTLARAGVLATTGHSTNFVLDMRLPASRPASHWIKRGVALFCSLSD
eukprot:gnl/Spiro4/13397_TR7140_c0_g1_i1.p1 gnl/Spiro4/13397_TR7140_c0_g1~~gnl/Spiro4/13397_TR7140_c0_g1_i1.p1  ORF type:complete len:560 (+),score=128.04 gnl/Spiro4/13397_TR7140_c0_g1_i1:402-2081(+)